ncbi:CoA-transferase subunit beta [Streptacidiphilus carbonis]|uniref:CoA-transferase subunit beta n=1 Tax=Streptacidiphilus carbonis TaxID=105422 RepID=UPI0005A9737D|nr:CoA-transferase [Streptacidiphilus carbonis]
MTTSTTGTEPGVSRAEYCVIACAEAWRGDGEVLAAAMGVVPTLGARLAKLTFEPDLLITDGEALLAADVPALGATPAAVEGALPYRKHLELVAMGHRHVMMGAGQLDRHGNQNISAIGDWSRPARQLLGVRGAPGNTVNNPTSYWIPRHSTRVFVTGRVDVVSGVGHGRLHGTAGRFQDLRRIVTDLAVLDFGGPERAIRLVSVHPGATVEQVVAATGFPLVLPDAVPSTREPSAEELRLIRDVLDPRGARDREVRG